MDEKHAGNQSGAVSKKTIWRNDCHLPAGERCTAVMFTAALCYTCKPCNRIPSKISDTTAPDKHALRGPLERRLPEINSQAPVIAIIRVTSSVMALACFLSR